MAPLSFTPAAEATYRNGVFSQYPAKLLGEQNQFMLSMLRIKMVTNVWVLLNSSPDVSDGKPAESKSLKGVVANSSLER